MGRLAGRDVEAVLGLVGEINAAETLTELHAVLLPALRRLVPADFASYNEVLDQGRVLTVLVDPEVPPELLERWSRYGRGNPLIEYYARTRDGRPYRFSDLVTSAELEALPVYQGFFAHIGVRHQIALALPSPPNLVRGIALSRKSRDFSDRERDMLALARPHLVQGYRNALVRSRLRLTTGNLAAALEQLAHPALIVEPSGRVVLATPQASGILSRLGGREGERLPESLEPLLQDDTQPVFVQAGQRLLARLVRLAGITERVVVLEPAEELADAGLRGLGLSPREGQVLRAFALGASPAEAARQLGISVRTVHKHTQHIHAKLGTRDRAQAVATALAALRTSA